MTGEEIGYITAEEISLVVRLVRRSNGMAGRKMYFTYMLIHQHLIRITIYHNLYRPYFLPAHAAQRKPVSWLAYKMELCLWVSSRLFTRSRYAPRGCRLGNIMFYGFGPFYLFTHADFNQLLCESRTRDRRMPADRMKVGSTPIVGCGHTRIQVITTNVCVCAVAFVIFASFVRLDGLWAQQT